MNFTDHLFGFMCNRFNELLSYEYQQPVKKRKCPQQN